MRWDRWNAMGWGSWGGEGLGIRVFTVVFLGRWLLAGGVVYCYEFFM